MTPGQGDEAPRRPRNPLGLPCLEVRVRPCDFPERGWLSSAWPSRCQSQYSSSKAARKGAQGALSEAASPTPAPGLTQSQMSGPGRAHHPDSHTCVHKDEEVAGAEPRH